MINKLRQLNKDKSIAILGSAPSVKLFERKEDVTIGVNGAGQLLRGSDIFVSGDERAHTRSWFLDLPDSITCILRPQAAIYSSRFYPDYNTRSKFISFYE